MAIFLVRKVALFVKRIIIVLVGMMINFQLLNQGCTKSSCTWSLVAAALLVILVAQNRVSSMNIDIWLDFCCQMSLINIENSSVDKICEVMLGLAYETFANFPGSRTLCIGSCPIGLCHKFQRCSWCLICCQFSVGRCLMLVELVERLVFLVILVEKTDVSSSMDW